MSASNREAGISKTLTYEGGFTNNPHDPGGPTNWGITQTDARLHWKPDASAADVKAMPKSVAIEIYRQKYWAKIGCDDRPDGVDFVEFDLSVNSGTARATSWRAQLDPQGLDPVSYIKAFCAKRSSFLHSLKTWQFFGAGWGKRVADVEATGVHMALMASGTPARPVLRKSAATHAKKAITHSTVATSAPIGATGLPFDLTTLTGVALVAVGIVVVAYFVWSAVQANHRASAYTNQLKKA
jgi:lysozyme family protein